MLACNGSTVNSREVCHNNGLCIDVNGRKEEYACLCSETWNSQTNCSETFADALGHPTFLTLNFINAIQGTLICLLLIPEIIVELIFDRRVSWNQPYIVAKAVFIAYAFASAYVYFKYAISVIIGANPTGFDTAFLITLQFLLLVICFSLIIIGWLTLVLRAKNLGLRTRAVVVFRVISWVAIGVIIFVYIACYIISAILNATDASESRTGIVSFLRVFQGLISILWTVGLIVGSTYFIVEVLKWTMSQKDANSKLRKVHRTTLWILCSFAGLAVYTLTIIVSLFVYTTMSPSTWLAIEITRLLANMTYHIGYFMIIQRFVFGSKGLPFSGYAHVFNGSFSRRSTTSSSKSSKMRGDKTSVPSASLADRSSTTTDSNTKKVDTVQVSEDDKGDSEVSNHGDELKQ